MWHMANGAHGQWGTWVNGMLVNTADRHGGPWGWIAGWGTWAIGHMGNRATSLILHGSLQKFYWT